MTENRLHLNLLTQSYFTTETDQQLYEDSDGVDLGTCSGF